jgi:LmbE family N-acetylglucosaminyl deacetylase
MTHLFIVSHVDDAELSCGGVIQKLNLKGEHVKVYSLSYIYNTQDLSGEFIDSMECLGVKSFQYFNAETRRFNVHQNRINEVIYEKTRLYDNIYTHSLNDRHPDHRIVAEQVRRVHNGNLFTFLCPWNGQHDENKFVEISEQQLEKKIEALRCYKSQSHRAYMSEDFIRSQAIYNGVKCGKKYAEAFRIEKMIV